MGNFQKLNSFSNTLSTLKDCSGTQYFTLTPTTQTNVIISFLEKKTWMLCFVNKEYENLCVFKSWLKCAEGILSC